MSSTTDEKHSYSKEHDADHDVNLTEVKEDGVHLGTDDDEFPHEEHQFTWYVFPHSLKRVHLCSGRSFN